VPALAAIAFLGCVPLVAEHEAPQRTAPLKQPEPEHPRRDPEPATARVADLEADTFRAVNDRRRAAGLGALARNVDLDAVARAHSRDQARTGGGSRHDGSDGRGPAERVRDAGIGYSAMAENVAMNLNYDDPVKAAVDGWMDSPGHRRNILEPRYRQTGLGVAIAGNGAIYFTQVFLDPPAGKTAPR